jgi:hypothetical protein
VCKELAQLGTLFCYKGGKNSFALKVRSLLLPGLIPESVQIRSITNKLAQRSTADGVA